MIRCPIIRGLIPTLALAAAHALAMESVVEIDASLGGAYPTAVRIQQDAFSFWATNEDVSTAADYRQADGLGDLPKAVRLTFGQGVPPLGFRNLPLGTNVEWTVAGPGGSPLSGSFRVRKNAPRWIVVPTRTTDICSESADTDRISNVRDLGGWPLVGGKGRRMTRQGVFYRGARLEGFFETADNRANNILNSRLGIRTELDLRGDENVTNVNDTVIENQVYYYTGTAASAELTANLRSGFTTAPSCADGSIRYFRVTIDPSGTLPATDKNYRDELRKAFHVLGTAAYRPIYFHCNAGRDRTGLIAFLVNALAGVTELSLYRDNLSTKFSSYDAGTITSERTESYILFFYDKTRVTEHGLTKYGLSLAGRVRAYLESIGVTPEEIASIIDAQTGETPDELLARVNAGGYANDDEYFLEDYERPPEPTPDDPYEGQYVTDFDATDFWFSSDAGRTAVIGGSWTNESNFVADHRHQFSTRYVVDMAFLAAQTEDELSSLLASFTTAKNTPSGAVAIGPGTDGKDSWRALIRRDGRLVWAVLDGPVDYMRRCQVVTELRQAPGGRQVRYLVSYHPEKGAVPLRDASGETWFNSASGAWSAGKVSFLRNYRLDSLSGFFRSPAGLKLIFR